MTFAVTLTEKSTERKSQPQVKKKGKAILAGYFGLQDNQGKPHLR
jgi:hypothetical protein